MELLVCEVMYDSRAHRSKTQVARITLPLSSTVLHQCITLDQHGHLNLQMVMHLPGFCVYNNEVSAFIVIKYILCAMFLLVESYSGKRQFQLILRFQVKALCCWHVGHSLIMS